MTTATDDRHLFRETVALVAEKARARLPQAVNGRVESAVKLVLLHDVTPQVDGSILVGSSSDPMKQYRLEGHTCTCQDFAYGKGIEGWCAHRIAAGIAKRVRELLPVAPPVETEPAPVEVPEGMEPWADNDFEEPEPEAVDVPRAAPATRRRAFARGGLAVRSASTAAGGQAVAVMLAVDAVGCHTLPF